MSGHSKWSTIKHQKAVTDKRRGQLFTKLARGITLAAKEGGDDPETNFKLRLTMDKAKQANMPKENIKRAIKRGGGMGNMEGLSEVLYEGYGPEKVAVLVEVVTDNTNRTVATIKKVFERSGGRLGEPGSVKFLFSKKGNIFLEKLEKTDEQILKIIDLGVEEVEEVDRGIEIIVEPKLLFETKKALEALGFTVKRAELIYGEKSKIELSSESRDKVIEFLTKLDELDDVQNIYSNADL